MDMKGYVADILHVPASILTDDLLNEIEIHALPKGSFLIRQGGTCERSPQPPEALFRFHLADRLNNRLITALIFDDFLALSLFADKFPVVIGF